MLLNVVAGGLIDELNCNMCSLEVSMKELYRKNEWALAILDRRNYVIYDHTKPRIDKKAGTTSYEMSYFASPVHAIRELSRRLANEACTDLKSWVEALQSYQSGLEELLTAK